MSDGGIPPQQTAPPGWYQTPDGSTAWWDGYAWHQEPMRAPTASLPYRPVAVAGALAQAALAAAGAASLLLMWAHLRRRQAAIAYGDQVTFANATRLDDASALVGLFSLGYLVAFVAAAVAIPVLCNRIHHDLDGPLSTRGLEYTPGWAAGWWFVPIANLFVPYKVVAEAWRASDPAVPRGSLQWRAGRVPALLGFWWACFVISGIAGRFRITVTDANGVVNPGSVQLTSTIEAIGCAFGAVGAVLAVLVFRQLTQRLVARAQLFGLVDG